MKENKQKAPFFLLFLIDNQFKKSKKNRKIISKKLENGGLQIWTW